MEYLNACCEKIKPNAEPIYISSRIRLARNLAGEIFPNAVSEPGKEQIFEQCRDAILTMRKFSGGVWYDLRQTPEFFNEILVEKNLISRELKEGEGARGAFVSSDASACIMVNEEDHLRIQ
ncbi:MAG: hypothetical protein IKO42_00615, partial [Opitutales bacterium]|nr:hypothetical protein [Opitutales bacterium]